MADINDVNAKLVQALAAAERCADSETSDRFAVLNEQLQELDSLARDTVQSQASPRALAQKLSAGEALTPSEVDTLRFLLVGDADYYLKYDEDFAQWRGGLGKIVDQIRQLRDGRLDTDALMHLRVLCHEARSILTTTGYYLEQKERVHRFEDAIRDGIDRDTGKALGDMIAHMGAA